MTTSLWSPPLLTRCLSQDLTRIAHQTQEDPSPTPLRSNSFVSSRRCGVVSEQDVLRLAAVNFDGDTPSAADLRQPPKATQATPRQWPAPVLRQRSGDSRPRPMSTGYLPSNVPESQTQQRMQGQEPQNARGDVVDTPLLLQNVALLPNRQLIQQPVDSRWRQWNSTPQRKGRLINDVSSTVTSDNGLLPTSRNSASTRLLQGGGSRPSDRQQQLLAEREAELRAMRSTMEKNESAILRAMDDQRQAWEADVAAERELWERRLFEAERQVDDVRQTLIEKIRQLERENTALQLSSVELEQHSSRHHQTANSYEEQHATGRAQRIDDDKSHGRDSSRQLLINGVDGTPHETLNSTRGSTTSTGRTDSTRPVAEQRWAPSTEPNSESAEPDAATSRLPAIPEGPMTRCPHCKEMISELEQVRQEFDAERQQWLTEKRRVIAYQKLLQTKYVELERRYAELVGSSTTDRITRSGYANGDALHGAWKSSSSTSLLFPRLIPFGQSIET